MRFMTASLLAVVLAAVGSLSGPSALGSTGQRPTAPTGGFTTSDGAVLLGLPGSPDDAVPTAVTGWARSTKTTVRRVRVTWCPGSRQGEDGYQCGSTPSVGEPRVVRADLACRPSGRRCDWRSAAPTTPGRYVVVATVVDARGLRTAVGPLEVTVL